MHREASGGRRPALEGLEQGQWEQLRARCVREAQRMLRDPGDAEDAAQEALLRIWRHGDADPPRAWLSAVVRNEALRVLERRQRRPLPADPTSLDPPSPHDLEQASLDAVALSQLMAPLAESDQMLLRMRYQEDLTQREMARRLGLPEGTVKVRLHRLRGQLRETMESISG